MGRCSAVEWDDFGYYVDVVVAKIKKAKYRPDIVVGIPRGGLPLAVALSNILNVPMQGDMAGTRGKAVLLCDDISDTGETLQNVLKKSRARECRVATVLYRFGSKVIPDFYGDKVAEPIHSPHYAWIKFPWEA